MNTVQLLRRTLSDYQRARSLYQDLVRSCNWSSPDEVERVQAAAEALASAGALLAALLFAHKEIIVDLAELVQGAYQQGRLGIQAPVEMPASPAAPASPTSPPQHRALDDLIGRLLQPVTRQPTEVVSADRLGGATASILRDALHLPAVPPGDFPGLIPKPPAPPAAPGGELPPHGGH